MMKWHWDGGWNAIGENPDGTKELKQFTSTAMARQFVEQQTGLVLAKRHKKHKPNQSARRARKSSTMRGDGQLTPHQKALKAEAMKQFAGL